MIIKQIRTNIDGELCIAYELVVDGRYEGLFRTQDAAEREGFRVQGYQEEKD